MGLDQHLKKKIYIGANYEHRNITGKVEIFKDGREIKIDFKKISYIDLQIAYWRKSNQIHKWFVENIQDGEDDCGEYIVSEKELQKLKNLCDEVLKDNNKAEELLPNSRGFLFGSQEYDEYYFQDLKYTSEILNEVLLENGIDADYYYSSSW